MSDDMKKPWWFPVLTNAVYCERLRRDYEDAATMTDEELIEDYADGRKYAVVWDHTGDAYEQFEHLADAYLAEHDETKLTAEFIRRHTTELDNGWREFDMELEVRLAEPFTESEWRAGWEEIPACLIPETVGELRQMATKCGFELKERR